MPNAPATPASVASRLTDKEILSFARFIDGCADDNVCTDKEAKLLSKKAIAEFNEFELRYRNITAVLRDYVRLRRMANAVKESVARCDDLATLMVIGKAIGFKETVEEIKRLLAESEKGEAK